MEYININSNANRPPVAKPQQPDQLRVSQSPFAPVPSRPTPTTQRSTNLDFFPFEEEKEDPEAAVVEQTTPVIDYYDESIEYEDLLDGKSISTNLFFNYILHY